MGQLHVAVLDISRIRRRRPVAAPSPALTPSKRPRTIAWETFLPARRPRTPRLVWSTPAMGGPLRPLPPPWPPQLPLLEQLQLQQQHHLLILTNVPITTSGAQLITNWVIQLQSLPLLDAVGYQSCTVNCINISLSDSSLSGEECQKNLTYCKAWTMIPKDQTPQNASCYFLTSCATIEQFSGRISGDKSCPNKTT